MNCFNIRIFIFTLSATLNVKSGLSTVKRISGLKSKIALRLLILLLILNIFNKTL